MGKFSDYLDSMKTQTDTLREVVSEKSGVDCSEMSIGSVAEVVKDIETGGKDPVLQEKSVDPKTYSQEVTADEGYDGLSKLSVEAVTSNIDANITPTNIRAGVSILGVQGNLSSDKPDQTKRVTPKTTEQSVFADAGYELGEVIVEAVTSDIDSDIKASNIKRGINILGVDGTFDGGELQSKTVTPTTSEQNVTPDAGFYGLSGVKVNAVNPSDYYKDEEIVNVTPTTESQKITPTANKVFNEVNVSAVTSAIDSNILADNIKKDVTILGVTGTLETGTDLSDTTATPSDVLSGKEFYNASGEKVSGTIETFTPSEVTSNTTLQTKGKYVDGDIVINVTSSSGGSIEIELPSEFANAFELYSFQVNDNILISADVSGIGVWAYSVINNRIEKVYDGGNGWKHFQQVGDKCLITSSQYNIPSSGVLIYDGNTITRECEGLYYMSVFTVIEDKCFISSTNNYGIAVYDGNIVTKLYDTGSNWTFFKRFGNKLLISSTGNSGILVYDGNTITRIYDSGSRWENIIDLGDKWLISSTVSSNDTQGILIYDGNTITKIYDSGFYWRYFSLVGDKCLIGSSQSNGILIYDGSTITKIYDSTTYYSAFKTVGDKCLIGGGNSTGVLIYDGNTITQLYDTGSQWSSFKVIGDKCLIGGYYNSSSTTGVLIYDGNTITQLYNTGYGWQYFQQVGDKCLIGGGTGASGVLVYDGNTITRKYTTKNSWKYFKTVGDKCLIGSSSSNTGVLVYNGETITQKYKSGSDWSIFIDNPDGSVYIKSLQSTVKHIILKYDTADNSVKVSKLKVV